MSEKEIDIFIGVEAEGTNSLFDLYRTHNELLARLRTHINEAAVIRNEEGDIGELSANLRIAKDDIMIIADTVSEAIPKILNKKDGAILLNATDRFNEVAALLCDDRLSRLNIYRGALGLEEIEEAPEYSTTIVRLCHEYEDDIELSMDNLEDELIAVHLEDTENDYPEFVTSLMTGEVGYWVFDVWVDDSDGNG